MIGNNKRIGIEIGEGSLDIVIRSAVTGNELDRIENVSELDVAWLVSRLEAAAQVAFEKEREDDSL